MKIAKLATQERSQQTIALFPSHATALFLGFCFLSLSAANGPAQTLYQTGNGFGEISNSNIVIGPGGTAEIFGYFGQAATISGAGSSSSTLSGFVPTSDDGSDTPLFLYNPANETSSGAVVSPTIYSVAVSSLTITNGSSHGGSTMAGGGGAGLGGGAFVGAGVTLTLNNVSMTGNAATGGNIEGGIGSEGGGGGFGGNSSGSAGGGLFANGGGGGYQQSGGFGQGGGTLGSSGFGGGTSGVSAGFGGGGFNDGGSGLGGGIFVQNEGTVMVTGNSAIYGNTVTAGTGLEFGFGANGDAAGADIFMMSGSSVTLAPGVGNTITIGTGADDADGQVSDVADDSASGLPGGTASGAALTIGSGSGQGGTVILHGNNTYAGGTSISNDTTLEVFQDDNLGASTGALSLSSSGELLTDSAASGGFVTSRDLSISQGQVATLAAVAGTTATYEGTLTGTGKLDLGEGTNDGTVNVQAGPGFAEIAPNSITIAANTTAGLFGYVDQSTTIRGAGSTSSTLSGYTVTTSGNGSDTPLFLYNPANETASGAVVNPTIYSVAVSNLTVTNGSSHGGSTMAGGGGAGLGGGAFVGAGVTLTLNNVSMTGNAATGGNIEGGIGSEGGGGGLGGNSSGSAGGGLFANGGGGGYQQSGGFGQGGGTLGSSGFGGGTSGVSAGFGGGGFNDGGSGLGGGIFVQNEGTVMVTGNSAIYGNTVTAGTGLEFGFGANGDAAGADIFMMSGSSVTLAPGVGNTITIGTGADDADGQVSDVADDSASGLPGGTASGAALTIGSGSGQGGTVILHGNNTYAGGTSISNDTTLEVFQDDNLGASTGALSLSYSGELLTDSSATGGFTSSRSISILYTDSLAAANNTSATYNGVISGSGQLNIGDENNTGTVILAGPNTYNDGTEVVAGFLGVDNTSGSGTGTKGVTVDKGSILGGTGTIAPSAVNAGVAVDIKKGGILSPSDGTGEAHLTFALDSNATLSLDSGAKLVFDLGAPTGTNDEVLITGGKLTLNNQIFSDFTFNAEEGFGAGTYTLIDSSGGITGSLGGSTTGVVDGYDVTLLENSSDDQLQLDVVAVPEPSTWAMLLGGIGILAVAVRMRRVGRM